MLFDLFGWLMIAISLAGTVLNIHGRQSCWWVWSAGNLGWIVVGLGTGVTSLVGLNLVYLGLNAWGLRAWSRRAIS